MKTEFLSETLLLKSLVEDSVINGARREQRRLYFKGTRVFVKSELIDKNNLQQYLLVESLDKDYAFDLVCISGYNSGHIYGIINYDRSEECKGKIAVTKIHLINELVRNLGNLETCKIIDKNEIGVITNIEQIEIKN